jgi:hypothetical protein
MSTTPRKKDRKATAEALGKPFHGLFGDTAELRVLQEVVADPFSDYTHHDLMELTELSDPSVRRGARVVIENISSDRRSPLYRPNRNSKKLMALTLLSYAILDDENGTDYMGDAVRDYIEPRGSYMDLPLVPIKKDAGGEIDGARLYLSIDASRRLSTVLQDVVARACKEGRVRKRAARDKPLLSR